MKLFRYFLREISLGAFVIFLSGCASVTGYPKPVLLSLSNGLTKAVLETKVEPDNIYSSYCSDGRQIKSLTLALSFISPKNPVGWPLNKASEYMKILNQKRRCASQTIFYAISEEPDCQTYLDGNQVVNLLGEKICGTENRNQSTWFLYSQKSVEEIESAFRKLGPKSEWSSYEPVFVRSISGQLIGGYVFNGTDNFKLNIFKEMFGDDVKSFTTPEWMALVKTFTILEPLGFQKATYSNEIEKMGKNSACNLNEEYFGINEDGNADVAAAVNQKSEIWQRYVTRFSNVKESSNEVSPQIIKTQVSLDLNAFCRYGRSISELSSK